MKKFLLSIFAMFLAFANLQAEEVTVYTLEPAEGSNNSYAGNCDIAIGDITWNLTGNSTMIPWRIGGKSITDVDRTLYSKNPMAGAVDKVVLSIGTVNSITVNSAKLLVADNADFTNAVETPFTVTANSDSEIAVTAPAGSYYKFVFNVTVSGSSNKYIQISKAVFYSSTSGETTAAAAPSLPADCSFTESKTIEITNNEEGATVYYTTDGENFNEYVGEFTINETTTVKAYAQIGDDVATKSFEVERTYTKLEAKTIAEVIEAGEGEAYTKGTVVATYAKGFLLNDETGYILVYQGNAPTVAEGDVININGTTSMYGGLLQFAAGANIEKTGTAEVIHPEAVVMDGAAFDAFLTAPEVKYVEYIGTLTINGNYYNVAVEGAETAIASIQYPNDGLVTVESGTVIKVTGYTIGYNKSYVNTMAVKVEAYVEPEPPFEVVAVTPTEPVAELTTVTVEFSEEIEGTFEMMGMTQIYLGTKSNGCSFEVNGKVLTITPFNAINTPGEYKLVIPAGLITRKSNGEAVTMNGEYVFTVKEAEAPFEVVAVTPAEDEVVNSLREITIEFDAEIAVKELSGTERISIQYLGISTVLIGTTATVEGNTLKLVADSEIKDAGKHTLVIPAGVVTRVSDGVAYEGGTFTFTVEKAAVVVEPLTVVAVTPAESVEKLETITIEFSDKVDVPATASGKFTIADADGNNVATLYAWDAAVDGKVVTLTLTEAITTAGEYTFSFAEGLVTRQGDGATCAYTCTINVTGVVGIDSIYGEAGNCVIYDITGRKIEKITEGGIYIVNGKKVLVK